MKEALEKNHNLIAIGINEKEFNRKIEERDNRKPGIVGSHAYAVHGLATIESQNPPLRLVKMSNPHGVINLWDCNWSRDDEIWKQTTETEQELISEANLRRD